MNARSVQKTCHPERSRATRAQSKDLQYPAGSRAEPEPEWVHVGTYPWRYIKAPASPRGSGILPLIQTPRAKRPSMNSKFKITNSKFSAR